VDDDDVEEDGLDSPKIRQEDEDVETLALADKVASTDDRKLIAFFTDWFRERGMELLCVPARRCRTRRRT
jgi:hypothetical protein